MQKINFENLPSTNTPLNADTLNGMQNGIEKSANYIGSTQPSTGERVWLKTGKNLLDKRNIIIGLYSIGAGTYSDSADSRCTKDMIEIDNTKNYILSVNSTDASAYMYVMYYNANKQYLGYTSVSLKDPLILNTYSNYSQAKFINIRFDATDIPQPMLEKGNSKTSYEDYVADTYIKDGNIFRNFFKPENTSYNTLEQKIGTWIDGKPLYRKVYTSSNYATNYYIPTPNIEELVNVHCMLNRSDYPNIWQPVPSRLDNAGMSVQLGTITVANNTGINMIFGTNWSTAFNKIIFIVEYTKTTN